MVHDLFITEYNMSVWEIRGQVAIMLESKMVIAVNYHINRELMSLTKLSFNLFGKLDSLRNHGKRTTAIEDTTVVVKKMKAFKPALAKLKKHLLDYLEVNLGDFLWAVCGLSSLTLKEQWQSQMKFLKFHPSAAPSKGNKKSEELHPWQGVEQYVKTEDIREDIRCNSLPYQYFDQPARYKPYDQTLWKSTTMWPPFNRVSTIKICEAISKLWAAYLISAASNRIYLHLPPEVHLLKITRCKTAIDILVH